MTRSIDTLLRRVQSDLPITDAETDVLNAHIKTVIARNARIAKVANRSERDSVSDSGYYRGATLLGNAMTDQQLRALLAMAGWGRFRLGDHVRKVRGSQWQGRVVGFYSTKLTPDGYCVESDAHAGSVQIYPDAALELDQL